ncbi:type I-E CRISPR-associated protein Cse2/CasB [Ligilactobacillus saerimneri]|uniref:type I-E CRISPR-associated protein Cse2/CasB n=1 Tax=Ligilactobacillus saerimneri TaxID=228229 RepID=UPI003F232199
MARRIQNATQNIIDNLFNNGAGSPGNMAALRATKTIDDRYAQRIWPLMMPYLSAEWIDNDYNYELQAIYQTLRLYALHQQGQSDYRGNLLMVSASKKDGGIELLEALAILRQDRDERAGVDRQVARVLAAPNLQFLMNALVRLVKILKAKKGMIKIDYAQLAQDLYSFQWGGDSLRHLRFKWGAQYYYSDALKKEDLK